MSRARDATDLLRTVYRAVRNNRVQFLAAAIAFYGFVSIIPLVLLTIAVAQFVDGSIFNRLLAESTGFLTPSAIEIIREATASRSGSGGATIVGVLGLGWSASKVFRGLDVAFSEVYGVERIEPLSGQLVDAALVLVMLPAAVIAAAVLGVVLPLIEGIPLVGVVSRLGLFPVLLLVFLPMYYQFPDTDVTVRDVLPGAAFTAVGWGILATTFSIYTDLVGGFQLYGVLGAGLLLVTWLYLGGIIIMVGAVLNAVLAGGPDDEPASTDRSKSERTEPAPDIGELATEVRDLRADLDAKTVSRSDLEGDLKQYVRRRLRRGKARGWGPYLVLLYGTLMTLGAFYWLSGGWAILAMVVVWLSTLGLYVLMVLFGMGFNAVGLPGRLAEAVRDFRS